MELLVTACSCGLDPATESMAIQAGMALAISGPFWFRDHILNGLRRVIRGRATAESEACASPEGDDSTAP